MSKQCVYLYGKPNPISRSFMVFDRRCDKYAVEIEGEPVLCPAHRWELGYST